MAKQLRARKIFLSHKQQFAGEADELHAALKLGVPGASVFQSEDIEKGDEWRRAVDWQLDRAKCFVLLYTSPEKDWSWCFYEAGRFSRKVRKSRPVVCLRPKAVELPSPLAHLQGIAATRDDIRKWLEGEFFEGVRSREPDRAALDQAVETIEKLVSRMPTTEKTFKPYIWIVPKGNEDWRVPDDERKIDFSSAQVEVDEKSATQLSFADTPKLELLPFLRRIACDTTEHEGKVEFWITKFFESLRSAIQEKTNFQEGSVFPARKRKDSASRCDKFRQVRKRYGVRIAGHLRRGLRKPAHRLTRFSATSVHRRTSCRSNAVGSHRTVHWPIVTDSAAEITKHAR